MTEKKKIWVLYGVLAIFMIFVVFCIVKEITWLAVAVPLFIGIICLYFFALDKVLMLITFATPLSVSINFEEFGISASFPSEILLLIFTFFILFKFLYDKKIDKNISHHPVSVIVIINLVWYLITCFTSEIPLVSFKHLLAQVWFIVPCYFTAILVFKNQKNINRYLWLFAVAMLIVVVYALVVSYQSGFSVRSSSWGMKPFFPEHTSYGAVLTMIITFLLFASFSRDGSIGKRLFAVFGAVIAISGLIFSYVRAAWLSGIIALVIFILFKLKIKFRYIIISLCAFIALFFAFQDQVLIFLSRNNQNSSKDIVEHIKSVTNISSDASNLERINRWQSAIRMFEERPVFGWGPGTYQFLYAPFQLSKNKTIASTNAGDNGNAHSEYLGPLSERGLLGMLITIAMFVSIIATANKVYWKSKNKFDRNMSLCCMLTLITYMFHGLLNNFLDIDKAALIFWLNTAIIVSIDIKYRNESKQLQQNITVDT